VRFGPAVDPEDRGRGPSVAPAVEALVAATRLLLPGCARKTLDAPGHQPLGGQLLEVFLAILLPGSGDTVIFDLRGLFSWLGSLFRRSRPTPPALGKPTRTMAELVKPLAAVPQALLHKEQQLDVLELTAEAPARDQLDL
jgi:hypothetical protein